MNNCERLLDDAVAAYDESLADERDRHLLFVCETFNRIFPDWSDDCVEVDDKGVTLDGGVGVRLEIRLNSRVAASYFEYSHRTEGHHGQTCWETIPVASLADLGYAVTLHREEAEMNKLAKERIEEHIKADDARLDARNAALDAYEKKGWLGRLFSKHPGYGVER